MIHDAHIKKLIVYLGRMDHAQVTVSVQLGWFGWFTITNQAWELDL